MRKFTYRYSKFSFQTAKLFSRKKGIGLFIVSMFQMIFLLTLRCFGFLLHSVPRISSGERSGGSGDSCALLHVFEQCQSYGKAFDKFWGRADVPTPYNMVVIYWCPYQFQHACSDAFSALKLFGLIFLRLKRDLGLREAVNVSVRYTSSILLAIELSFILKDYNVLYLPVEGNPWEKFLLSCLEKVGFAGELRGCQYSVIRYGDGCILRDVSFQAVFSCFYSATESLSSQFSNFVLAPRLMPVVPVYKRPRCGEISVAFLPEAEMLEEEILNTVRDQVLPVVFANLNQVRSLRLTYRYHPRSSKFPESSGIARQATLADFLRNIDLVIGRGSYAVVEAFGFGIPVCLVKVSDDDQSLPIQIPESPRSQTIILGDSASWNSLQMLIERIN